MFTRTEIRILRRVATRGSIENLIGLANDLDISYPYASRCLAHLERRGLLSVHHRGRAVPIVIKISSGLTVWQDWESYSRVTPDVLAGRQPTGGNGGLL